MAKSINTTELVVMKKDVREELQNTNLKDLGKVLSRFLELSTTSTGRATFYNTKTEQLEVARKAVNDLHEISPDLPLLCGLLPGLDFMRQETLEKNFATKDSNGHFSFLSPDQKNFARQLLFRRIQPARRIRTALKNLTGHKRGNNYKTRHLVLQEILNSPELMLWSVKYRSKLNQILQNAWGQGVKTRITKLLENVDWTLTEVIIPESTFIFKYVKPFMASTDPESDNDKLVKILECISFILGSKKRNWELPLFREFEMAKQDLTKGKNLPPEILQGIRSTYHKDEKISILEITKETLTKTQKKVVQAKAKKENVKVAFNPMDYTPKELYIFAYEQGMTDEIKKALEIKAKKLAKAYPYHYKKVGVILDTSKSMEGHGTQKYHPIASSLSLRDMLYNVADECLLNTVDKPYELVTPEGGTSLGEAYLDLLEQGAEAVYVLSDGYENMPQGLLTHLISNVREKLEINTPVIHLNPVVASETDGVRSLGANITTLPVLNTEMLSTSLFKMALDYDPLLAIEMLIDQTVPELLTA